MLLLSSLVLAMRVLFFFHELTTMQFGCNSNLNYQLSNCSAIGLSTLPVKNSVTRTKTKGRVALCEHISNVPMHSRRLNSS